MSLRNQIITLIAKIYDVEENQINDNSSFEGNLQGNERQFLELVMACEEEFDMIVRAADVDNFLTVGAFIRYLESFH